MITARVRRWIFQPIAEIKRVIRKRVLLPLDHDFAIGPTQERQQKDYEEYIKRGCK